METSLVAAGSAVAGIDLAFIVYDIVMAARQRPPSRTMAALELSYSTIQMATGLGLLFTGLTGQHQWNGSEFPSSMAPIGGVMAAVSLPLMLHAIRGMREQRSGMHARLMIAPAALSDGKNRAIGLAVGGRF